MIPLAISCHIVAASSHEVCNDAIRPRRTPILTSVSAAANECLSRMVPRLPNSFSGVSAKDLGTKDSLTIPFQISHPDTLIPSGEKGKPIVRATSSQSEAYAVNLFQANPMPVAVLPRDNSFIMSRR